MTAQCNRHSEERSDDGYILNKIVDSSFRSCHAGRLVASFRM